LYEKSGFEYEHQYDWVPHLKKKTRRGVKRTTFEPAK